MITKRLLRFALGPSFLDADHKRENTPSPYKIRIEKLVETQNQFLKLSEVKHKFRDGRVFSHFQAADSITVRQHPLLAEVRDQIHLPYSASILVFYNITTRLKFRITYGLFNKAYLKLLVSDTISCFISVIHDGIEVMLDSIISYGIASLPEKFSRILISLGTDILLQPIRELKILHSASLVPPTRLFPFLYYNKGSILLGIGFFFFKEAKKKLSENIFTYCVNFLQKFSKKTGNKNFSRFLDNEISEKAINTPRYIEQSKYVFKMMMLDNISSIVLSPVQIALWGLTVWNFGNSPRSLSYFPSGIVILKPNCKLLLLSTAVEIVLFFAMNESFNIVAEDLLSSMKKNLMRGRYIFLKTLSLNGNSISDRAVSENFDEDENEDEDELSNYSIGYYSETEIDDISRGSDELENSINDSDEWIDDEGNFSNEDSDYSEEEEEGDDEDDDDEDDDEFIQSISQYLREELEAQRVLQAHPELGFLLDQPNIFNYFNHDHDHSDENSDGRSHSHNFNDSDSDDSWDEMPNEQSDLLRTLQNHFAGIHNDDD